jgi:glycosyltransferase involved in cell wall biosynthesis
MQSIQPRKILNEDIFEFEFSICTLVTDTAEYAEMCESFFKSGFTENISEYIYIDNSKSNTFGAYAGLNRFLREAKGKYIILCHQDILLHRHNIVDLRARIEEISNADPTWAVLGNAGSINIKYRAVHIIQGSGKETHEQYLPIRTATLDENFIIVKRNANLALSSDIEGFHFYGTDICLIADVLGYSSYVIDFKLLHKSDGNADEKFYLLKRKLISKYGRAFRSRFIGTTITRFYISGNSLLNKLFNTRVVLFLARQYYKIFKTKRLYYVNTKGLIK